MKEKMSRFNKNVFVALVAMSVYGLLTLIFPPMKVSPLIISGVLAIGINEGYRLYVKANTQP